MGKNHRYRNKQKSSSKKHKTNTCHNHYGGNTNTVSTPNLTDTGSVYTDLISLDDSKRLKACRLLCNLLATENKDTLLKVVKHDILARLTMRLIDSNADIKYEALGAIRNLSTCSLLEVADRLIECGVLEALLSLTNDALSLSNLALTQQLFACLNNILSFQEKLAMKFSFIGQPFISALFSSVFPFQDSSNPNYQQTFERDYCIIDFLLMATDNLENINTHILTSGGLHTLSQQIKLFLQIAGNNLNNISGNSFDARYYTLHMKLYGVLFNLTQSMTHEHVAAVLFESDAVGFVRTVMMILTPNSHLLGEINKFNLSTATTSTAVETDASKEQTANLFTFIQVAAEILCNISFTISERFASCTQENASLVVASDSMSAVTRQLFQTVVHSFLQPPFFAGQTKKNSNSVDGLLDLIQQLRSSLSNQSTLRSESNIANEMLVLESLDRLSVCFNNILDLHQYQNSSNQFQYQPVLFTVDTSALMVSTLSRLLESQLVILDSSESDLTQQSQSQQPSSLPADIAAASGTSDNLDDTDMKQDEGVNEVVVDVKDLVHVSLKLAVSVSDCLVTLCRVLPTEIWHAIAAASSNAEHISMMQGLSLLLCKSVTLTSRWTANDANSNNGTSNVESFEITNITRSAIECIATLTSKDNDVYAQNPQLINTHDSATNIISVKFNALLTNSLLRRMELLSVSASESSHIVIPATTSTPLLLYNACLSCLIDLHSSDHVGLVNNYSKMKVSEKLIKYAKICRQMLGVYQQQKQQTLSTNTSGSDNDDANDEQDEEREIVENLEETLNNLKSFISYKKDFMRSVKML